MSFDKMMVVGFVSCKNNFLDGYIISIQQESEASPSFVHLLCQRFFFQTHPKRTTAGLFHPLKKFIEMHLQSKSFNHSTMSVGISILAALVETSLVNKVLPDPLPPDNSTPVEEEDGRSRKVVRIQCAYPWIFWYSIQQLMGYLEIMCTISK